MYNNCKGRKNDVGRTGMKAVSSQAQHSNLTCGKIKLLSRNNQNLKNQIFVFDFSNFDCFLMISLFFKCCRAGRGTKSSQNVQDGSNPFDSDSDQGSDKGLKSDETRYEINL